VDGPLSRTLFARRKAARGAALLERRAWPEALRELEEAAAGTTGDAEVLALLARARAGSGDEAGAAEALLAALALGGEGATRVAAHPDLARVRARPEVAAALAGE
jgi:predicted Zn-dependent protease